MGPKSPFSSQTQQSIVESKVGIKFADAPLKNYIKSSRTVSSSDLQSAITTKPYLDPGGSDASAYYTRTTIKEKSYNLKVIYNKTTNTIYHFHYSRSAMGPLSKIAK